MTEQWVNRPKSSYQPWNDSFLGTKRGNEKRKKGHKECQIHNVRSQRNAPEATSNQRAGYRPRQRLDRHVEKKKKKERKEVVQLVPLQWANVFSFFESMVEQRSRIRKKPFLSTQESLYLNQSCTKASACDLWKSHRSSHSTGRCTCSTVWYSLHAYAKEHLHFLFMVLVTFWHLTG